jgi:aldehyde dehydrogenase (NAD+)
MNTLDMYIDGRWVESDSNRRIPVVNPANEEVIAEVTAGTDADVQAAVDAARAAFQQFSETRVEERIGLLDAIAECYERRSSELADLIHAEMGAPEFIASVAQVPAGLGHLTATRDALAQFSFSERVGTTQVEHEPVGVCALITPWNWPLNQITAKVAPAIAAGCTMVLKPSEIAPLNAMLFAEIMHEAGVPAGVFNLVNGDGPSVGAALSSHPSVDMVSFTGSTRAGIAIAQAAAPTVKRICQELGGKSANIILDDVDVGSVVERDVNALMVNSGQSCNAGSRILVPVDRFDEAIEAAARSAIAATPGPSCSRRAIGPVVSQAQFDKVQGLIGRAIEAGARVVVGGLGRPEGIERGYFVRPTVITDVSREMEIVREEIFGPVVTLIPYDSEDEAVEIANDTTYGLSGYVSTTSIERARAVARKLRTGMVHLNGAPLDVWAPFGGVGLSGNGREFGVYGLREFLEPKSVFGYWVDGCDEPFGRSSN